MGGAHMSLVNIFLPSYAYLRDDHLLTLRVLLR